MGDISKNFDRKEFACKCECGFDTVDITLISWLQQLRDKVERPIHINSGCRCPHHNTANDGSKKSQHMKGRAADITVDGMSAKEVWQEIVKIIGSKGGLGRYDNFTHIDSRTKPARWDKRVYK
jgi:uncharacterized protein YcbK (DUF882 family)